MIGKGKYSWATLIAAPLLLSVFSSCRHKDIDFDEVPMNSVKIMFDWSQSPQAFPASMQVWLYFIPEESPDSTLRFDFPNRIGGEVSIPYGHFSGLTLNSDNTNWAHFRNTEDIEQFEIYTHESTSLPSSGLKTRALPRAREAEEETMVEAPGMVWSARNDAMSLQREEKTKTFIFYPKEIVCHYTVDVFDVANLSAIEGTAVDATLSGMAGGFLHGKEQPTDTRNTIPFILNKEPATNSLHGEFLTFGESPVTKNPHKLAIYTVMEDGQKYLFTFDVSSQIYDAGDPKHVRIVVRGLSLPTPIIGDGGFSPDVSDWESVEIDLPM